MLGTYFRQIHILNNLSQLSTVLKLVSLKLAYHLWTLEINIIPLRFALLMTHESPHHGPLHSVIRYPLLVRDWASSKFIWWLWIHNPLRRALAWRHSGHRGLPLQIWPKYSEDLQQNVPYIFRYQWRGILLIYTPMTALSAGVIPWAASFKHQVVSPGGLKHV